MEPKSININGYDTCFTECEDSAEKYLLIAVPPNADKNISDIAGTFVNNHLIKMIDYATTDDIRFIKAYY
nr:hypothetical protein [uncultured Blautia sp.]